MLRIVLFLRDRELLWQSSSGRTDQPFTVGGLRTGILWAIEEQANSGLTHTKESPVYPGRFIVRMIA